MRRVPPAVTLHDPDDFASFAVVVSRSEHAHVAADTIRELAGERADDPAWAEQFAQMLEYAERHGWIASDGAVRAHIEWAP
jgi:hypothetical protein